MGGLRSIVLKFNVQCLIVQLQMVVQSSSSGGRWIPSRPTIATTSFVRQSPQTFFILLLLSPMMRQIMRYVFPTMVHFARHNQQTVTDVV